MPQKACPCGGNHNIEPVTIVVTTCKQKHSAKDEETAPEEPQTSPKNEKIEQTLEAPSCTNCDVPFEDRNNLCASCGCAHENPDFGNMSSPDELKASKDSEKEVTITSIHYKLSFNTIVTQTKSDSLFPPLCSVIKKEEKEEEISAQPSNKQNNTTSKSKDSSIQSNPPDVSSGKSTPKVQFSKEDMSTQTSSPILVSNKETTPQMSGTKGIKSYHNMSAQTSAEFTQFATDTSDLENTFNDTGDGTFTTTLKPDDYDEPKAPVSEDVLDESQDFEDDNALPTLPVLPERYHGVGCAMEICIMEKHDKSCKYRKSRNSKRNPVDDRSGEYDVVGRMSFRTCGGPQNNKLNRGGTSGTTQNPQVYSVQVPLTLSFFKNENHQFTFTESNMGELMNAFKEKCLLHDLALSDKQFCNNEEIVMQGSSCIESLDNSFHQQDCLFAPEVTQSDKSLQVECFEVESGIERIRKKWYAIFFSCSRADSEDFSQYTIYEDDEDSQSVSTDFGGSVGSQVNMQVYSKYFKSL